MPLTVLQPVQRRRRRRRRFGQGTAVLAGLTVVALVATGSVAAARHFLASPPAPAASRASAAAPAAHRAPPPRLHERRVLRGPLRLPRPAPAPKLLSATLPLDRHRFEPALSASAAILVDGATGRVLWALHAHERHKIASTSKIMTAVLALDRLQPNDLVTIDPEAARAAPNREGLRPGERVRAWKLFYGLLLFSGNDDALALAIATAGSRSAFIAEMNAKAHWLGMRHTHFATPSGVVDRDNYSTPWDMAILARYAMQNPRFRQVVRTRRKEVPWSAPTFAKVYLSKNQLLGTYGGANGIKTGWTTIAEHCFVASAERHGVKLIAVVLHSADSFGDARRLLDRGFQIRG